ncbi:hypothetical protein TNCV_1905521 [Trichonephila clavipes]|nr:hypothetical protein TNCV_1905521 [Trichonephila clavipes]
MGDFRKMKKFDQTPYKLLPPDPANVPAEKRPLVGKSLPFSKRRSKVRIAPVIRRVSRRPELPMAPRHIPEQIPQSPVQIPEPPVPEPPVQIPEPPVQIPEPPVQIPEPPVQIPEPPVQIPEPPVQIPEPPVQIPEPPVQIPEPRVQIPELDVLEPTLTDAASLHQLMPFIFGEELAPPDQELKLLHTVRITSQSILTPSFLNATLACTFLVRLEKQSLCLRVIWI